MGEAGDTFGRHVPRGRGEAKGVRDPFARMLAAGQVPGWERAWAWKSVAVDSPAGNSPSTADLVLLSKDGRVGVVECKCAKSSEAKHGMLEQVLMYAAMVARLSRPELIDRLAASRGAAEHEPHSAEEIHERMAQAGDGLRGPIPIVVIDRWGKTMNATAGVILPVLNRAFAAAELPTISVFAVGGGTTEWVTRP